MAGKPNTKWKETMLKKFKGNEQALKDHMAAIASKGGKKTGIIKGFAAMTEEKRREAGRLGGSISRRGKKTV